MIRVTVELVPFGIFESRKIVLGVAEIANDMTGDLTRGNYTYKLFGRGGKRLRKSGVVSAFERKRLLAWDLLYRVLADAI